MNECCLFLKSKKRPSNKSGAGWEQSLSGVSRQKGTLKWAGTEPACFKQGTFAIQSSRKKQTNKQTNKWSLRICRMIALYLAVNRHNPEHTEGLTICPFNDGVASRAAVTLRGEIAENVRSEV